MIWVFETLRTWPQGGKRGHFYGEKQCTCCLQHLINDLMKRWLNPKLSEQQSHWAGIEIWNQNWD